jgi:lipopolysaccharide export system permease protein
MPLLDRYLLKEWLKVFGMALGAMIGLLLIGQIQDSMPDFIQWKTATGKVLTYYLWQVPMVMPIVLPVATLVSMLFLLGHLHKNQELTAMRAAGLSVWRITRTLWIGGASCTILLLTLNSVVIPHATEAVRTIRENAKFDAEKKTSGKDTKSDTQFSAFFENGRDHRRWRIASLGAYTGQASGLQVYELNNDGAPIRQTFAEHGRYDEAKGCWIFENGREFAYENAGRSAPERQRAFTEKTFPVFTEKPMHMLLMTKKPSGLSLREISTLLSISGDISSSKNAALEVRYHSILAGPFSCLVVVGLAIPFAVAGVRTNPMVGVSKAIGVFVLYYMVDRVGYTLGAQQVLPAILAAWIPNLIAITYAARLCRKVN